MQMRDNTRKAKEFLRSYQNAIAKVEAITIKLEEIKKSQYGTSIKYSDMPKAHNITDLSDYAAKLDEFERKYEAERLNALEILDNVTNAIDSIDDVRAKRVLYYRYISNLTWESMLKPMMVSWQTVHNYHAIGLKQIAKYLEENNGKNLHE